MDNRYEQWNHILTPASQPVYTEHGHNNSVADGSGHRYINWKFYMAV